MNIQSRYLTQTIIHLAYPSMEARRRLITIHLIALNDICTIDRWWFFADVVLTSDHSLQHGLEVVIYHRKDDQSVLQFVQTLLCSWQIAGLVVDAIFTDVSLVLQSNLFIGEFIPASYSIALAAGSARAITILRAIASNNQVHIMHGVVREEIAATFRTFIPPRIQRLLALKWYIAWLKAFSEDDGDVQVVEDADNGTQVSIYADMDAYKAINEEMLREIRQMKITRLLDSSLLHYALIARLVHTQVVRLWGPDYPNALRLEVKVIYSVLHSLGGANGRHTRT